ACATFDVQAPVPSPTPSPSPSPTTSPSPSPSPSPIPGLTPTPLQTRNSSALSGLLLSPFGIVLLLVLLAALGGSIVWLLPRRHPPAPGPAAATTPGTGPSPASRRPCRTGPWRRPDRSSPGGGTLELLDSESIAFRLTGIVEALLSVRQVSIRFGGIVALDGV